VVASLVSCPSAPVSPSEAASRPGPLVSATVAILVAAALVVAAVPLCVVVGIGWLVERTDPPGRALWCPLLVAPLDAKVRIEAVGTGILLT
jgi:iron(III) transport system permease protein